MLEIPANTLRWVKEMLVRLAKALEALVADGRLNRVGRVSVVRE